MGENYNTSLGRTVECNIKRKDLIMKDNYEYKGIELKLLILKAKIYSKWFKFRTVFPKKVLDCLIKYLDRFIKRYEPTAFIDKFNERKIK